MSISTPFIHRPVGTSLFIAAMVLVGLAAYPLLPVAPLPRVDFPTVNVNTKFPGASPETMATAVAQPLERQFAQIAGIAQMTSISVQGSTQITIQFDLDRNIDAAAGDIQAAINAASGQLPKNLPSAPNYYKVNPSEAPILILAVNSDTLPLIEVDDYADTVLAQQISQLAGVAQVFIAGEQKRAVRVQVDPAKLAAMGLTMEDVRTVLISATVNAPKGSIDTEQRAYSVYTNDQLTKADEYANVILNKREASFLFTIAVNNRLTPLQHSVDHDGCDIAIWVVVFLPRSDDVVWHGDHVLHTMYPRKILEHEFRRPFSYSVWVLWLWCHIFRERKCGLRAVACH